MKKDKVKKLKVNNRVKKLTILNIYNILSVSLTPLLRQKSFLRDCKTTLEFCNKVESWLKGMFIPSIIPIVNSMCINLKLPNEIKKLNSCLMIGSRGTAKSELLREILAKNNPEHFIILPTKIFESELVKKEKTYFHNKILIRDDLIPTFEGLSRKQRQQLNNFWVELLEGHYARDRDKLTNVRTMVLFGFASEMLNKFRQELLSTTFFDRVPPFKYDITQEHKKDILKFRSKIFQNPKSKPKRPIIKLPLPKRIDDNKKVLIKFPYKKKIEKQIIDFALEQDLYEIQSFARSQDYIKVFMMSNALLNNRKKVTINDLYLYALVHPLFIKSGRELGIEKMILTLFKKYPDKSDKELLKKTTISKPTFYKYKKILKRKGLIE